jgi:hypothetical protein
MACPNCGAYGGCYCTWEEQQEAMAILRREAAEARRKFGNPTVVERDKMDRKKRIREEHDAIKERRGDEDN